MEEALKRFLERRGSKVRRSFIFMYMMTPLKPNMKYKGILVFLPNDRCAKRSRGKSKYYLPQEGRERKHGWMAMVDDGVGRQLLAMDAHVRIAVHFYSLYSFFFIPN